MEPTGEQAELRHGGQRVVVVEAGGGIRAYHADGRAVLAGYDAGQVAPAARGQLLIPWPNRLHRGRYSWDGTDHELPITEPAQNTAIHGLTRWLRWSAGERSESAVTMRLLLLPQPGYPFALDLAAAYALADDGLTVTVTATNVGDVAAPYAAGAHPYLAVAGDRIDEATLRIPAGTWLPTGPAQIPIGREPVAGTPYDFREPRPIGPVHLDHAFTDLHRDGRGRAVVSLTSAGLTTLLWVDESHPYLEIFTADALPGPARRGSLGVEPMTCPPNGLQTGEDVIRIEPGATVSSSWGVVPG